MKFSELSLQITDELMKTGLSDQEASFETREIMTTVFGKDPSMLALDRDREADAEGIRKAEEIISRRRTGEPLAYILGERNFYGMDFTVSRSTLIPRFETELLCEKVIAEVRNRGYRSLLDLCTGSGCIAVTVNRLTGIRTDASDIDVDAIQVARHNSEKLGADVRFIESDLFEMIDGRYDVIVSNPPYISEKDFVQLDEGVRGFEPQKALLAGEDGLMFYRRIIPELPDHLNMGGMAAFEIGYDQAEAVVSLLRDNGFDTTEVIRDYAGFDRIVTGVFHK